MTAYEMIKASFKELLRVSPLEKVTVSDICKKAGISRKTFYSYFLDKNDVMTKIFCDEILKPINSLRSLLPPSSDEATTLLILEKMYQDFYDDKDFYEKIISYAGQNCFSDILIEQISATNLKMLSTHKLSALEREYMAYYFAASQTMLLIKWIRDKMVISPKQMANFYGKWAMRYWKDFLGDGLKQA